MSRDVNLWFAKNDNGEVVLIESIKVDSTYNKYYCPLCGSEVIPKATDEKSKISAHFAHIDKNKCKGEDMVHWWTKNKMFKKGEKFYILYKNKKIEYKCKEILIEKGYETNFGVYKPDITIITDCNNRFFFEICYKNKKKASIYIDIWNELNISVVEIVVNGIDYHKNNTYEPLFINGEINIDKFKGEKNYINTIGTFKKEAIKRNINVEDLKKLNWFWIDIIKTKNENITVEEIINVYDSIEDRALKELIFQILNKAKCNNILDDMLKYKKNLTLGNIHVLIKDRKCDFSIIDIESKYYSEISIRNSNVWISINSNWIYINPTIVCEKIKLKLDIMDQILKAENETMLKRFSFHIEDNDVNFYGEEIKYKWRGISVGGNIKYIEDYDISMVELLEELADKYKKISEVIKIINKYKKSNDDLYFGIQDRYLDLADKAILNISISSNKDYVVEKDVFINLNSDDILTVDRKINIEKSKIIKVVHEYEMARKIIEYTINKFGSNQNLEYKITGRYYNFPKVNIEFEEKNFIGKYNCLTIEGDYIEKLIKNKEKLIRVLNKIISDRIRGLKYNVEFNIEHYFEEDLDGQTKI